MGVGAGGDQLAPQGPVTLQDGPPLLYLPAAVGVDLDGPAGLNDGAQDLVQLVVVPVQGEVMARPAVDIAQGVDDVAQGVVHRQGRQSQQAVEIVVHGAPAVVQVGEIQVKQIPSPGGGAQVMDGADNKIQGRARQNGPGQLRVSVGPAQFQPQQKAKPGVLMGSGLFILG